MPASQRGRIVEINKRDRCRGRVEDGRRRRFHPFADAHTPGIGGCWGPAWNARSIALTTRSALLATSRAGRGVLPPRHPPRAGRGQIRAASPVLLGDPRPGTPERGRDRLSRRRRRPSSFGDVDLSEQTARAGRTGTSRGASSHRQCSHQVPTVPLGPIPSSTPPTSADRGVAVLRASYRSPNPPPVRAPAQTGPPAHRVGQEHPRGPTRSRTPRQAEHSRRRSPGMPAHPRPHPPRHRRPVTRSLIACDH
jgi:hypothetical protein